MPRVIVCDVNETLLDVGALAPHFKEIFGDGRILHDWFTNVLLYSEVATLAGPYADFSSIAAAVLDMLASAHGLTLSAADRDRVLQDMLTLPADPDVRYGLQTIRDAGLRLVTLTNSAPAALEQQLSSAGLTAFFEHSFSVDAVHRFKPAPEVYRLVADSLGLPVDRLRLVAAHAWDIVGALRAGCAAASSRDLARSSFRSARGRTSLARTFLVSPERSSPSKHDNRHPASSLSDGLASEVARSGSVTPLPIQPSANGFSSVDWRHTAGRASRTSASIRIAHGPANISP